MSSILHLINRQLTPNHISVLRAQIGAPLAQTQSAIEQSLPRLLGTISQKASSSTGLSFLSTLLDQNHDGSALDDIMRMYRRGRHQHGAEHCCAEHDFRVTSFNGGRSCGEDLGARSELGSEAATALRTDRVRRAHKGARLREPARRGPERIPGESLNAFLEKESMAISRSSPESFTFMPALLLQEDQPGRMDDMIRAGKNMVGQMFSGRSH